MAPIRRYLRITKYSVLEVRIYLDNPAHTDNWLLKRTDPALPRVIEAVRPLVLPKLREENERAKGSKGKGKKGVKDVISGDDFEVSIFLTDLSSRHALLTKQKEFTEKQPVRSNSGKLTGWLNAGTKDAPLDLSGADGPAIRNEEDDNEVVNLGAVPDAEPETSTSKTRRIRNKKDSRTTNNEEALFVDDASSSDGFEELSAKQKKQGTKNTAALEDAVEQDDGMGDDDKKKLGMATQYDGFSIYGRILCLVVKRKGARANASGTPAASSQQMLENWVSTQAVGQGGDEDDDEG